MCLRQLSKMASLQLLPLPRWTRCQAQGEIQLKAHSFLWVHVHTGQGQLLVPLCSHAGPTLCARATPERGQQSSPGSEIADYVSTRVRVTYFHKAGS